MILLYHLCYDMLILSFFRINILLFPINARSLSLSSPIPWESTILDMESTNYFKKNKKRHWKLSSIKQTYDQNFHFSIPFLNDHSDEENNIQDNKSDRFDPYIDNGGTLLAIAGQGYVLIACDTRLSDGSYSILSRNTSRVFDITGFHSHDPNRRIADRIKDGGIIPVFFGGVGCHSDVFTLSKDIQLKIQQTLYHSQSNYPRNPNNHNNKLLDLSIQSIANLLSSILYSRRGFPYYSFSCVAGLDQDGNGAVYRYDAIGSYERCKTISLGKGEQLLQPLLDQIHRQDKDLSLWKTTSSELSFESSDSREYMISDISVEEMTSMIVKAFTAASEREISIGDGLYVYIIESKSSGISRSDSDSQREKDDGKGREREESWNYSEKFYPLASH